MNNNPLLSEDEVTACVALGNLSLPSRVLNLLLTTFASPLAAHSASDSQWEALPGLSGKQLVRRHDPVYAVHQRQVDWLFENGIEIALYGSSAYPAALAQIDDPPAMIFTWGEATCLKNPCVALVGSRKATSYGRAVAHDFSKSLTNQGVTVVSGGAIGIDTAAHTGAVDGAGLTVGVLGCGLDVDYPKQNNLLFQRIRERGVLISEYPPEAQPDAWRFPGRNRIISALSSIVVVVEAPLKSGALITAEFAVEHGKLVMAVPGNIDREGSAGCNEQIKAGATMVTSVDEIFDQLGLHRSAPVQQKLSLRDDEMHTAKPRRAPLPTHLSELDTAILEVVADKPIHLDQIAILTAQPVQTVGIALMMLELQGHVMRLPGNLYVRRE